jgi:general secretion pathway protein D
MDGSSTLSTHRRPPTRRSGYLLALALGLALGGCAAPPPTFKAPPEALTASPPAARPAPIPPLPAALPLVPPPPAAGAGKRYRVVVNHVPLRDVLFALARDAALNLDLRGELSDPVTVHVVDETVPQILARLGRQFALRYTLEGDRLTVAPDEPYFHTYEVDYVNLARDTETSVSVATQVATTGEGGAEQAAGSGGGPGSNSSSTRVNSKASHRFWPTLAANVLALIGKAAPAGEELPSSEALVVNPEAGLLSVKATHRQHAEIAAFIQQVLSHVRRQVLIEATVVEVSLNDRYQSGVDWQLILDEARAGLGASQNLLGALSDGAAALTLGYHHPDADGRVIDATLKLLHEFGDTRVLSSPRLMVLNNQTALLKVVEELVYFTVQVTATDGTANAQGRTVVQSEVHSVPVGLVMAVTPQISADADVTLTVRPTISQKIGEAIDPGPQLALSLNGDGQSLPNNTVPVIRTREMESVLKLVNGQVGVLGGLMQDEQTVNRREVPGLSQLPGLGAWLFRGESRSHRKTELVIFLRPAVVETPSVARDLRDYQPWLEQGARS